MLNIRLCILIALLLALVWCGGVAAGPKYPNYGDPDIVEGVRVKGGASQWQLSSPPQTQMIFDIPLLGRVLISWQKQGYHLRKMEQRLPAALKKDRSRQ
jgi:hypothetical protein